MARPNNFDQKPETHESYGVLQISRVSCSPPVALFGSSIRHGNLISLKICEGKKYRDYQRDRYMDGKTLIEVEMSATQFAEAITSLNVGSGTPVTIHSVTGDKFDEKTRRYRERCPEVNAKELATHELKDKMACLAENIEKLAKDAKEILEQKGTTIKSGNKKKLLQDIQFLIQEVRDNIPFAHECFNQSVTKTVTEAKGEIEAAYQTMREKLGDKVLLGEIQVPMLEEETNENE